MREKYTLTFITPCFCRGADCSENGMPEIRPSSIRGQLHWWFRALGGSFEEEKQIFGSVHKGAIASKVVLRVKCADSLPISSASTLPHKSGGYAAPKKAVQPGVSFELIISTRFGGLTSELEKKFKAALEAWLLMGSLGLRSTRAAGSFMWMNSGIKTFEEYMVRCETLRQETKIRTVLLSQVYTSAEQARKVVSDTLGGRDKRYEQDDLMRLQNPLGSMKPRKTSPLRFRIVQKGSLYRILAIWDGRKEVSGNTNDDLCGIINLLAERKPALGKQLRELNW